MDDKENFLLKNFNLLSDKLESIIDLLKVLIQRLDRDDDIIQSGQSSESILSIETDTPNDKKNIEKNHF